MEGHTKIEELDASKPIPENATILTKEMLLERHLNILNQWEPFGDMWALRFGSGVLSGVVAISASILHDRMRLFLNLGNYARLSSFIPATLIPTITCLIANQGHTYSRMLEKQEECPVCTEISAIGIQSACIGQAYAMIFVGSCHLARQAKTYNVPKFQKYKKLIKLYQKVTLKNTKYIIPVMAANVLCTSLVTYYQGKQSIRVWNKSLSEL